MLVAAPSVGVVLGPWGPKKSEGSGADGTEARGGEASTEVLELEAPQNALLEGVAPQQKYLQLAQLPVPWLEGEQSRVEATTDRR